MPSQFAFWGMTSAKILLLQNSVQSSLPLWYFLWLPRPPSAPPFLPHTLSIPLKRALGQCLLVSLPDPTSMHSLRSRRLCSSCITKPLPSPIHTKYFPALSHLSNANSPCKAVLPPPGILILQEWAPPLCSCNPSLTPPGRILTTLHSSGYPWAVCSLGVEVLEHHTSFPWLSLCI